MATSFQRMLNKMPQKKVGKAKLSKRKVQLSMMNDYSEARDLFYELNDEVADIFSELEKLKSRFQSIDADWQGANDRAYRLNTEMFNQLSELGVEDRANELFDEGLDLTNSYHGQDRVWNNEGLQYLRS